MLHAGLDLSDTVWMSHVINQAGAPVLVTQPLACKTDAIDAWVLAELSRRDLVPAIWLPTPAVRAERERAR